MPAFAIRCESLVKTYGDKLAVAGIDLTLEADQDVIRIAHNDHVAS